jgi:hypothetical protein
VRHSVSNSLSPTICNQSASRYPYTRIPWSQKSTAPQRLILAWCLLAKSWRKFSPSRATFLYNSSTCLSC